MPIPLIIAIGAGLLAGAAVAAIVYADEIREWLNELKEDDKAVYVDLIKTKLSNGDYEIVGNVFDSSDNIISQKSWETEEIDPELGEIFLGGDRVKIKI